MKDLDFLCINTIRTLSIDSIQKANSGHPGLPLGAAPMAYILWQRHLKHHPKDPSWPDRDRFVLSAGHGSMLLYSLLHLTGYSLSLDELKRFRQWGSLTPGHPEFHLTPGVEATTGPLGQGSANAVGMAISERRLAEMYNRDGQKLVDHYTYALVSDGDLMEGVSAEAASLAGHLKLGKLIYLYDANDVTLDGPASLAFSEDVAKRYESYGWHVQLVRDGDTDLEGIDRAITVAKDETQKPSLIIVKTTIGYGSPNKKGTSSCHGSPLGPDEIKLTKKFLGWDPEAHFYVPAEASSHFQKPCVENQKKYEEWKKRFAQFSEHQPELAQQWTHGLNGTLPQGWDEGLPLFKPGEDFATRESSGKVLNVISKKVPWLIGGDADLSCSTNTFMKEQGSFEGHFGKGRNIHFGVREHAMGAIANGIAYHGGLHPFTATFFCFSDYMKPSLRLAAMNHLRATFIFTHDSIGLGEDGPTHQPIEHLAALRVVPNMWVLRPADAVEVVECWKLAMERADGPVSLVFSRQKLPTLERTAAARDIHKGAYVLSEAQGGKPKVILIATGSEVTIALSAQKLLQAQNLPTRVVSMPSWELFELQDENYRQTVLPHDVRARISIEAGVPMGWERYVGEKGISIGLNRYGASAPAPMIYEQLGLTPQAVANAAQRLATV